MVIVSTAGKKHYNLVMRKDEGDNQAHDQADLALGIDD